MALSKGQDWAFEQIKRIAAASRGAISTGKISEPTGSDKYFRVVLSVLCKEFEQAPDGLPLNQREEIQICIPEDFPYSVPEAHSMHRRFRGFPHVQWGFYLCLYVAPAIEWNPADGMFGFVERLIDFLENGAMNRLDPVGAPIHRPVSYGKSDINLIPSVNAPALDDGIWFGFARINKINSNTYEVIGWDRDLQQIPESQLAPVFLFEEKLPTEFPETLDALIKCIDFPDALISLLLSLLRITSSLNNKDTPLVMIIGTPMRGIVGAEDMKIHIAAWEIPGDLKDKIMVSLGQTVSQGDIEQVGADTNEDIKNLLRSSKLNWVDVFENRPEIIVSRTSNSVFKRLSEKKVCLIGAGAIGSVLGEILVREGAGQLAIVDNKEVKPGIICRQNYVAADIGTNKATALKKYLSSIDSKVAIKDFTGNFMNLVRSNSIKLNDFDIVVDASASNIVSVFLSQADVSKDLPDYFSLVVNANSKLGLSLFRPKTSNLHVSDLVRSAKIKCHREEDLSVIKKGFWPDERGQFFQPEPGCSEPTFSGSYSDILQISNALVRGFLCEESRRSFFQHATVKDGSVSVVKETVSDQQLLREENLGYTVCLSGAADFQYKSHIKNAIARRGAKLETGGLLFGWLDGLNKRIHIDYVSDAPTDSVFRKDGFICGIRGVKEMQEAIRSQFGDAVTFVGTWHTHPYCEAKPSETDLSAAVKLLEDTNFFSRRVLIMIVSYDRKIEVPRFYQFEDVSE